MEKLIFRFAVFICSFIFLVSPVFGSSEVGADGSFNYSIPLDLPPATGGIGPELSLSYNSGSDNGLVGVGWSLNGYDVISRDPRYPILYIDPPASGEDHYTFMGQRLIKDPANNGVYHTENETYMRIELCANGAGGPSGNGNYWKITDKNGIMCFYGSRATDANGTGGGFIPVITSNIAGVTVTMNTARLWALDKVMDVLGNYYTIDYAQPTTGGWYPIRIVYTRNDTSGRAYGRYRAVTFDYIQGRPDATGVTNYGIALLTGISVYTNATLNSDGTLASKTLHHSYALSYGDYDLDRCGKSILKSVREFNRDGTQAKPPFTFTYTPNHVSEMGESEIEDIVVGDVVLSNADFNGDGKADLMTYNAFVPHCVYIYYSTPDDLSKNGGFPTETRQVIRDENWKDKIGDTFTNNINSVIQYGDFNGDGIEDFMLYDGQSNVGVIQQWWKVYLSGPNGFDTEDNPGMMIDFGNTSDAKPVSDYDFNYFDPDRFRVGDFNGDGKSDLISLSPYSALDYNYSAPWRVFLAAADGTGFFGVTGHAQSISFNPYANNPTQKCHTYDPKYFVMGDFNGDGNNDFIVYTDTSTVTSIFNFSNNRYAWVIYIADGNGSFTRVPVTADFGNFNSSMFPPAVYFADYNGDGCTDALSQTEGLFPDSNPVTIDNNEGVFTMYYAYPQLANSYFLMPIFNQPGNTFHTPLSRKLDLSQFGDFNGDGLTDFIVGCLGNFKSPLRYETFKFKTYFGTGQIGMPFRVKMRDGAEIVQTFGEFTLNPDFNKNILEPNGDLAGSLIPGDFDGNGNTDYLIRVAGLDAALYAIRTSNGDGSFSVSGGFDLRTHFRYDVPPVRIVSYGNFLGTGKTEVLAAEPEAGNRCALMRHFDTRRANLLETITNGVGGKMRITYFSAPFYYADDNALKPVDSSSAVINKAIVNTSVRDLVDTVMIQSGIPVNGTSVDGVGMTKYSYSTGMFFPGTRPERCALGFKYIVAKDMQTGCKTITYYNQDKSLHTQGSIKSVETYDKAGFLSTKAESDFWYRQDNPNIPVYFVYKTVDRYSIIEGSLTTGMSIEYTTEYPTYDAYGNNTVIRNLGNPNTDADNTESRIYFAVNTGSRLMKIYKQETYGYDNSNPPAWGLATQTFKYFDNSTSLGYIDKGWVTKTVSKAGGTAPDVVNTFFYDAWGNPYLVSDGREYTTQRYYENNYHMLLTQTIGPSPLNLTTVYTYDDYMNLTSEKDASNNIVISSKVYDSFNQPWKIMGPNDSIDDPLMILTYDYSEKTLNFRGSIDSPKYVKVSAKPAQGTTRIETFTYFNGVGQKIQEKVSVPAAVGSWKTIDYYYDSSGRPWKVTEPYNQTTSAFYRSDLIYPCTENFYDFKGRPWSVKYPDGITTRRKYGPSLTGFVDKNGNYTETKVEGNKQTALEYESEPTISGSYPIGPGTVTLEYRGGTKITDKNGNATTTEINMLGRRTRITSPDMGAWSFVHDGNGNIVSMTDAKGQTITSTYDNCNRLTTIHYPTGADTIYTYDESGHGYGIGRLTTVTYAAGKTSFFYNNLGMITSQTVTIDGISKTETFSYYPSGMMRTMTFPDNEELTFNYNTDGTISTVSNADNYFYISSTAYNLLGQLKTVQKGNSKTTQFDYYDRENNISYVNNRLRHETTNLSTPFEYNYAYYGSGDLLYKESLGDSRLSAAYYYDKVGRLTVAEAVPPIGGSTYEYDYVGNITKKSGHNYAYDPVTNNVTGDNPFSYDYTYYPGTNRLKSDGRYNYTYDANGNIIAKSTNTSYITPAARVGSTNYSTLQAAYNAATTGSTIKVTASDFSGDITPASSSATNVTFSGGWDSSFTSNTAGMSVLGGQIVNNLTMLSFDKFHLSPSGGSGSGGPIGSGPATYTYDYNNMLIATGAATFAYFGEHRVKKTENGVTTRYFFGDYEEESGTTVNVVKHYPGGAVRTTKDGLLYIYKDITGNPAVITDANGTIVNTMMYDPFGSLVVELGNTKIKYKFADGERDSSGLQCFGARYYDPAVGRFITADTIVPYGGTQCLNRYSYCRNNPINLIDPSGHTEGDITPSMASGQWALDLIDTVYKYSGLKTTFDVTDSIAKPLFKVCSVPLNLIGVKEVHFGIWCKIGGEISINCETGDYNANVGCGAGMQGGFATKYADIGGSCASHIGLGYDSADKSIYFKASGTIGNKGMMSGSIVLGYSFNNHVGYQSANVSIGPMQFGWSSYGSNYNVSYGLSFGGVSLSWSKNDGFGLGLSLFAIKGNTAGVTYNVKNGKWRGSVGINMCFVAGTKIETKDGEENIEDIKAGDIVRSYNEATGEFGYKTVVRTIVTHPDTIVKVSVGKDHLECTKEHPFFIVSIVTSGDQSTSYHEKPNGLNGSWVSAGDLKAGMNLLSSDGVIKEITSIESVQRNETTYNFEVEDWHTYCVGKGGFVVHNVGNGCGAADGNKYFNAVIDFIGQAVWGPEVCENHDEGYATEGKSKESSDNALFTEGASHVGAMVWPIVPAAFWLAVTLGGQDAYDKAQAATRDNRIRNAAIESEKAMIVNSVETGTNQLEAVGQNHDGSYIYK